MAFSAYKKNVTLTILGEHMGLYLLYGPSAYLTSTSPQAFAASGGPTDLAHKRIGGGPAQPTPGPHLPVTGWRRRSSSAAHRLPYNPTPLPPPTSPSDSRCPDLTWPASTSGARPPETPTRSLDRPSLQSFTLVLTALQVRVSPTS